MALHKNAAKLEYKLVFKALISCNRTQISNKYVKGSMNICFRITQTY